MKAKSGTNSGMVADRDARDQMLIETLSALRRAAAALDSALRDAAGLARPNDSGSDRNVAA